jgi:hypothetical protein
MFVSAIAAAPKELCFIGETQKQRRHVPHLFWLAGPDLSGELPCLVGQVKADVCERDPGGEDG